VDWWSVCRLGTGQHLFDTYVPLVSFSISKEFVITRYIGLNVPPDDTSDTRLKQPNVFALLTYASADRVLREALLTCDDAQLFRSYADVTRSVSMLEGVSQPQQTASLASHPEAPAVIQRELSVAIQYQESAHFLAGRRSRSRARETSRQDAFERLVPITFGEWMVL